MNIAEGKNLSNSASDERGYKTGNRIAKCIRCDEVRSGKENIRHRCIKGHEPLDPEEYQKVKSSKDTLTMSRIVWPHDMVEHPTHGITTWVDCDTPERVATFLDSLGWSR